MRRHQRPSLATLCTLSLQSGMPSVEDDGTATPSVAELRSYRTNSFAFLALVLMMVAALSVAASAQMVMDNDHEMEAAQTSPPVNYTIVPCGGKKMQSLPAGDYNSDLHVVGPEPCVADGTQGGGVYKYHWVFIHDKGTLTFKDTVLHLYANSVLVLNGGTLRAGGPSMTEAIGAQGGVVTIHLWGSKNDPAIPCQDATGKLDVMCGVDPAMWNSNKDYLKNKYPRKPCILPSDLKPPQLLPGDVNDCFYQYDDPATSNLYFGRKVLAVSYGGTLQLFGAKGSTFDGLNPTASNTGTSWRRLATNLVTGNDTFDVDSTVDWQEGDHIVITPTDYLPGHAEEAIIKSVDGNTITISGVVLDNGTVQPGGVQFPHYGTLYNIPADIKTKLNLDRTTIETRAAVALLSRSICVVSEGDTGPSDPLTSQRCEDSQSFPWTKDNYFGGHVIFRQGFKQVQVQGVDFHLLGQGALKGRYAVHFHMDRKVPVDTFAKDNSINESMTRWITVHGTQGLLLARNVGWKSIGHGFYIEDGTETDNKFYANIGILARAGVDNDQNPRKVPGILVGRAGGAYNKESPYNSDWQHPSVFWIMNGWNDFQYNMAAGAGTCGMCYWLTSGATSGPSRYEYWTGYASRQNPPQDYVKADNAGTSPLETFYGNACSTAMYSYMEIGNLDTGCDGFGLQESANSPKTVAAIPGNGDQSDNYYPITTGLRYPSKCNTDAENPTCYQTTNPKLVERNQKCGGTPGIEQNCMATVLDHYTTSFNFPYKNFSSIWMRQWWKLVVDSAITDQLGPGVTFVTGGGYTRSDVALGSWDVSLRDVFVGQTQPDPADLSKPMTFYASDLGPFTPYGIQCDNPNSNSYCLSKNNGISMVVAAFNAGQRMFNIYDGPSVQDSNGYLDIKAKTIPDCTPLENGGVCDKSKYMYGHDVGLLKSPDGKSCYIPNAAIAWKQENGFYYPPAFESRNLAFSNVNNLPTVDIRHFVVEPLFLLNTFNINLEETKKRYCTWLRDMFNPFNDIDRQTVLVDDDGSLTGLLADTKPARQTLSVNEDAYFRAPTLTTECASDRHFDNLNNLTGPPATAVTSPYQYVTTAIYPAGGPRGDWSRACTHCYGVPIFRQNWTAQDNSDCGQNAGCLTSPYGLKRPGRATMMGQDTGQRSVLTANQGWYYIDTTVPSSEQNGLPLQSGKSVFEANHTYYVFLVYATPGSASVPSTQMKYWMYVGSGADPAKVEGQVGRYRVNINSDVYGFKEITTFDKDNPDFLLGADKDLRPMYDPMSGMLKINVNLEGYQTEFANDAQSFCKPVSYCSWNTAKKSCGCAPNSGCKDDSVCSAGPSIIDCPTKGCFGFSFTLQPEFAANKTPLPPEPARFPSDTYWNVPFYLASEQTSGPECHYTGQPK